MEHPPSPDATPQAILWRSGPWRCEYWVSLAGPAELRVYRGERLLLAERVSGRDAPTRADELRGTMLR